MEDKKFEELLIAVKGKDRAEILGKEVKQVLTELLNGEFADSVKERKWKVMLKEPKGGGRAGINKIDEKVYLWVNPANWETGAAFTKERLKNLLRHELLHVESGKFSSDGSLLDDHDPKFKAMARARKIDIWNV